MSRFRPRHRGALIIGAVLLTFVPLAIGASAATPPPPQDTSAFCANATTTDPFTDTDPSSVHHANILCLVSAGITTGKTATTYDPSATVTRAQMATFIARAIDEANSLAQPGAGLNTLPPYDGVNRFADVSSSDTHVGNINRLAQAGVVNGKTPVTYDPTGTVTRGQMASFINRAEQFLTGTGYSTNQDFFTDDDGNAHEANINAIASVGIANGVSGTSYAPDQGVRRDQMASFIIRWLAVENAAGNIKALPSAGVTAQSASVNDADQSGALSKNDVITITFANPVAVTSSITLKDADNTTVTLTDTSPTPSGQTPATFTLDSSKKILTITPTGTVVATGGDGILNGAVTITAASGITDASSGAAWDPTKDTQSHVQFTFTAPAGQTGTVTFVDTANKTYRFVVSGATSETTVIYKSNDTFTDDGTAATLAKFESDLSVGDQIKLTRNTPSAGVNKHDLTNKSAASYTSGMVGNVNTTTHVFFIIEPVSGVVLSDAKTYNGGVFTLNGANANQSQFEAAINEGDTATVTAGTGGNPSTFALTDGAVNGAVSSFDKTNHLLAIGKLGDDPTGGQDASFNYSLANTTLTVDGASATLAQFETALSLGDTVNYTRVNNAGTGTQTFALTNHAPAPISGTVTETHSAATHTVTVVGGATRTAIDYTGVTQYNVNGVSSTQAQFEAAITAGDALTFQAADAATGTVGSATLTNSVPDKTVTGHVADVNGGGTTYDVVNDVGGIIYDNLNFTAPPPADFGNVPQRYFVKAPGGTESEVTLVQFEGYLNKISGNDAAVNQITTGLNAAGTAIEHHLVTDQTLP